MLLRRKIRLCVLIIPALLLFATTAAATDWVEYRSKNFVLYSDGKPKKVTEMLVNLEKLRLVVGHFSAIQFEPDKLPVRIYYTEDRKFWASLELERDTGGFMLPSFYGLYLVSGPESRWMGAQEILFHEYVHYLLRSYSSLSYPDWYEEGLADFYGATVFDGDTVKLGAVPRLRADWLRNEGVIPMKYIIERSASDGMSHNRGMFYAQSWAFTHFLMVGNADKYGDYRPQLNRYLSLFNDGADSATAFDQAFEEPYAALERKLFMYLHRHLSYVQLRMNNADIAVTSRPLSDAQRAYLLGDLYHARAQKKAAQAQFAKSLADDADNAQALAKTAVILGQQQQFADGKKLLDRALTIDHKDAIVQSTAAQFYFIQLMHRSQETDLIDELIVAAVQRHANRAIELNPNLSAPYIFLAEIELQAYDKIADALKLFLKARAQSPWNADINFRIGEVLAGSQEPHLAEYYLRRVAAWGHGGALSQKAEALLETVAQKNAPERVTAPK